MPVSVGWLQERSAAFGSAKRESDVLSVSMGFSELAAGVYRVHQPALADLEGGGIMLGSVGADAVGVAVHSHEWETNGRMTVDMGYGLETGSSKSDLEWSIYSIYV
jgi:hypothetical protein